MRYLALEWWQKCTIYRQLQGQYLQHEVGGNLNLCPRKTLPYESQTNEHNSRLRTYNLTR